MLNLNGYIVGRGGVDGLYAVVFGFGEEGVGGVHAEGVKGFRALDILWHARRDELHRIGLIVSRGGEDHGLAPQVFVSASGDVVLYGLATLWRVDAKGGVLLGGGVQPSRHDRFGCLLAYPMPVFLNTLIKASTVSLCNRYPVNIDCLPFSHFMISLLRATVLANLRLRTSQQTG